MTLEQQYAHALHELVSKNPAKSDDYVKGLKHTLQKKGHQKLTPQIFSQYKQIIEIENRSQKYSQTTPQQERTRVLLELYRTLVAS